MPNSSTSRFTRSLFSLVCALVFFSSSPLTFAEELEEVPPLLTVDDLDGDQFRVLAALAPVALGASATGNITNDVASILRLLQSLVISSNRIRTYPFASSGNVSIGALLGNVLAESFSASGGSSREDSFLYEIQRSLFGHSGVPSSSDAIQPVLLRILSTMSNQSNSWTRADVDETLRYAEDISGASWGLLSQYNYGSHFDAWDVWLEDTQFFDLLSAVGSVSNAVYDLGGFFSGGSANVSVDLSPVTDRQDRWQNYAESADSSASYQYDAFHYTATSRDQEDGVLTEETVQELHDYGATPPTMDAYTPASPSEVQDVEKDSLLDALNGDVEHPSRWVLLSPSDAQGATGQSFEMAVSFNEGGLGTFLSDATTIMSTGWYGLLAALSAVLFWRKQTEISAIVHGTNFSRV